MVTWTFALVQSMVIIGVYSREELFSAHRKQKGEYRK